MIIKSSDIRGYYFDGMKAIRCTDCIGDHTLQAVPDEIITTDEIEENPGDVYFCDRCGERI